MTILNRRTLLRTALAAPLGAIAIAADWPQWRGPTRDGLSTETGLLKSWPSSGPKVLWSISSLGDGYGSLAIAGSNIYVQGRKGNDSVVHCLDRNDGKTQWSSPLGRYLDQDRGGGSRGTPTLDGDKLFALSENGDLACLNAKDGAKLWSKNILKEYGGSNPHWLLAESPLVDGNFLVVTPGGNGAGVVKLEKATGKTVWTCKELHEEAGYSSCIVADIQGIRTYMSLTSQAGIGVRASDGKLMWHYEKPANRTANCATPIYSDNRVFYTSAYGTGCGLLELKAKNGTIEANEVYFNRDMQNHHGGVILVKEHLYGFSASILTCMDFKTGKVAWKNRSVGKGSLTYADGMLFLLSETNVAGLAVATPDEYKETGRFRIEDSGRPSWAHPVVSNARLYIRNQGALTCYDVKA
jgi:outer membrane protein assembly factor BamB